MSKRFQELQKQLAAHIRNPESNPPPAGIDDERLQVYRRLFFNNIRNFTTGAFPILSKLLGDDKWEQLNRSFFSQYRCHSPYFIEISKEFLQFLSNYADDPDTLFIYELAHFEWTQLDLSIIGDADDAQSDRTQENVNASEELGRLKLALSPFARLLNYRWPVHKANFESMPDEPKETALLAWRDKEDKVRFIECNAVSAALIDHMQTHRGASGDEHIKAALANAGIEHNNDTFAGGVNLLGDLWQSGAIIEARD